MDRRSAQISAAPCSADAAVADTQTVQGTFHLVCGGYKSTQASHRTALEAVEVASHGYSAAALKVGVDVGECAGARSCQGGGSTRSRVAQSWRWASSQIDPGVFREFKGCFDYASCLQCAISDP